MIRTIFILAILSITIISCKKDYTCTCQQTYITTAYTQNGVYNPQSTTSSTFRNTYKMKEEKAESNCNGFEKVSINTYGSGASQRTSTETVECDLN
jgi:hypothetical protein